MARGSVRVWLSIVALARQEKAAVAVRHAVRARAQAARAGAALSLSSDHGLAEPVFATDTRSEELEELQATLGQGPSMEALTGFAPTTLAAGFGAVHALPMRLREQAIGAVNLYSTEPGTLDAQTAELGQALADVATIGIPHERTFCHHEVVIQQLQNLLNSQIVIEQAKGVLAERLQLSIEDAFTVLRSYARDHNLKLADTAAAITRGELPHDLAAGVPRYHDPTSHESRD